MLQNLIYIGCGALVGTGLLFLGMGRISKHYGDSFGAGCALKIADILFLLAIAILFII
jgi:hypothetical protein